MLLLRIIAFTMLIPGAVTVGVPYVLLHSDLACPLHAWNTLRVLGVFPLIVGVAAYLWCTWDFAGAGKGTPAPYDPPRVLVTRGLYRLVRNPIYVGVVLIVLGEALIFDTLTLVVYAATLLVLFHLRIVFYEEPRLKKKFGASYDVYCRTVPSWLPLTSSPSPAPAEREGSGYEDS